MTLRNIDAIELICFVTHSRYQIVKKGTFPPPFESHVAGGHGNGHVAMVSYIYYGTSVVQVLSPREKVGFGTRVWD